MNPRTKLYIEFAWFLFVVILFSLWGGIIINDIIKEGITTLRVIELLLVFAIVYINIDRVETRWKKL